MGKRFGDFGGCYIPEVLWGCIEELTKSWSEILEEKGFWETYNQKLTHFAGRETPLYFAEKLSQYVGGPKIFLKREDLLHTGAHKINNSLGQCLLAKSLGKKRVIAETGAGQHGVATATACAHLDLECCVYMGAEDMRRQEPNVKRMKLLGADVCPVSTGSKTLKDAVNEALRDWSASHESTHYCIGSALGPHPFPDIVERFQSVIGKESKRQILSQEGSLPDVVIACVGGGSNAIGIFSEFLDEKSVQLIGIEAGGRGDQIGDHAARIPHGSKGVFHGSYTYLLQDENGNICNTHSISAGLDYPAIGPHHCDLHASKRAQYYSANDESALLGFKVLSQLEGIIPALESAHAIGYIIENKDQFENCRTILVNLSGRGDKDLPEVFNNHPHIINKSITP